ncbi:LacI family transcriptional regulator [Xylanimonas oleitrophica]|uniref:LacI family transcriptional regulator n=1 Tax=Xylanimonas oleitrophica TaxID=2607479 RepID=A0A2W5WKT6_9MICO|nr:LacI family DNA-binding transcriptional regulator [Xylanimonas oleitrophica]PZR51877.1 LacI family transcriptional regulator [Xylanimonas oleitrophica]
MSAPPQPTSRDVARLAGVSQTTVSYALTGRGTISAATRERVQRVAESIGYRPNLAARSMRTRRSGRLAVVTGVTIDNHLRMVAGAGEVAQAAGYVTETHSVGGTVEDRTQHVLELAAARQHEGILTVAPVLPTALSDGTSGPVVVAATAFDDQMRTVGDLADASMIATFVTTLAAAGHRRFVHVAGSQHYASARARRDVYLAAVERSGVESLGVLGGESWSAEAGRQAVLGLPDDAAPLVVVAGNDLVALGVLRGAAERGWSAPRDVVLTGWDNYEFGAYTTPSLTTVDVDFREAGRRAMHQLVATLRGEEPPSATAPLHRIVWRESTGEAGPGA